MSEEVQDACGWHICRGGFEHHVAVNLSQCADVVEEAFTTYLGFETYRHG